MTQISSNELSQPWLHSAPVDLVFILTPAFITSLLAWYWHDYFASWQDLPLWAWVSLVLCVDVAHVYATLFRTYWHPTERQRFHSLLVSAPLLVWTAGTLLYLINALLFWRILAYLAVFHFIRQQFGFVRLYSKGEKHQIFLGISSTRIDQLAVYAAALFPLIWWHTHLPRNFHWFTDGDFVGGLPMVANRIAALIYFGIGSLYLAKEITQWHLTGVWNAPRCLIIFGTACSWFIGIVAFDNDMAFTLTNVISHGIPYMALVWIYNQRDKQMQAGTSSSVFQQISWKPFTYLAVLLLLAYLEESFWDGIVWHEHTTFFAPFLWLPATHQHAILALIVPLLTVPQATHYLLDGFIWKSKPV